MIVCLPEQAGKLQVKEEQAGGEIAGERSAGGQGGRR